MGGKALDNYKLVLLNIIDILLLGMWSLVASVAVFVELVSDTVGKGALQLYCPLHDCLSGQVLVTKINIKKKKLVNR